MTCRGRKPPERRARRGGGRKPGNRDLASFKGFVYSDLHGTRGSTPCSQRRRPQNPDTIPGNGRGVLLDDLVTEMIEKALHDAVRHD
jgi:hypothetical protein